LIELLVVIAIIALLIGILIPALRSAREAGRRAVCMQQIRGFGRGMAVYASQWDGWLAGPNTSGALLSQQRSSYQYQGLATEPLQNQDWISPTMGADLGLSGVPGKKVVEIFNSKLRCPDNNQTFAPPNYQYDASTCPVPLDLNGNPLPLNQLSIPSYQSNWYFHWYSDAYPDTQPLGPLTVVTHTLNGVIPPHSFRPNVDSIGNTFNDVDFTDDYNQWVGNPFMGDSPDMTESNGTCYRRVGNGLGSVATQFAYRHESTLNAVFFDLHVERMNDAQSRTTRYWFPTGSIVAPPGAPMNKLVDPAYQNVSDKLVP
jgi:prepilin-type processing-associated H-X9-DG protein